MAIEEAQLQPEAIPSAATPSARPSRSHWALTAIGIATVLGLCYWAEMVLSVMMASVLLAFILAPVVDALARTNMPRGVAAIIAVLLLLLLIVGLVSFFSNQAISFFGDLTHYTSEVREEMVQLRHKAEDLGGIEPSAPGTAVAVEHSTVDWTAVLLRGFGSVTQALIAASFVPFLVYFMLTWHHHVRSATVMLFSMENRNTAYVTLGLISAMIRSFMVGNLLIGLFLGAISTLVFGLLHFPFFYFVGFISGFLSLIPYLGLVLAMVPPILVGLGHTDSGAMVGALATVFTLHVISLNVLYPNFLGNRLKLNPLAATMALLIWGWLWGGIGLVLAIPITAAMKIVFDHVESLKPYGAWMGE
jgi:predicted PurR-regulated permease PerM